MRNDIKDTIAAVSTPIGQGGIGIIRVSGDKAITVVDKIFRAVDSKKLSKSLTHTVHYGYIVDPDTKEDIDEVLVTLMKAPKTFTKENVVEINCHGGIVSVKKVLEEVLNAGVRLAEAGEFTKRAFLSGRIDLVQAEAVCDIITSKTESSLKMAVSHLEGGFSQIIKDQRQNLIDVLSNIEAQIDFSYEDVKGYNRDDLFKAMEKVKYSLEEIFNTKNAGRLIKEGLSCVICGKPNVGKSSLLNILLKHNRAIVTDIPGTTRDVIEEMINIDGIPLKIVDTAGITKTNDIVEKEGVKRTKDCIKNADIVILILDLSKNFSQKDKDIIKILPINKTMVVGNKCDLEQKAFLKNLKEIKDKELIKISVLKNKNIKKLEKALSNKVWGGNVLHPQPNFINNIRHQKAIEKALKSLTKTLKHIKSEVPYDLCAVDLRESIYQLGLIIGESADINILQRIFSRFCIGK